MQTPIINNQQANKTFRQLATTLSLDPDSKWIGGYVEYEWDHARHIFELHNFTIKGAHFLEFGCNVGASAVILAHLGAKVTAIDVDKNFVALAKANAERYGVEQNIKFLHIPDTRSMPFDPSFFDAISCNSVLEYVNTEQLPSVLHELNRVLKNQGLLFITGTSNRLWPKEIHSNRWFTNYIPEQFDSILFNNISPERGITPRSILKTLSNFSNLDLKDRSKTYLEIKEKIGISKNKLLILKVGAKLINLFGLSIGCVTPNISLTLQKKN